MSEFPLLIERSSTAIRKSSRSSPSFRTGPREHSSSSRMAGRCLSQPTRLCSMTTQQRVLALASVE